MDTKMKERYQTAEKARVGQDINCPACNNKIKKRSYQHKFCGTKCKDRYWNSQSDRLERGKVLGYIKPVEVTTTRVVSGIELLIMRKGEPPIDGQD